MVKNRQLGIFLAIPFVLLLAVEVVAAPAVPRVFTEGKCEGGELRYINDIPVLIVSGTPEEIGGQKALLTTDAVKKLIEYPKRLLERANRRERIPKYLEMCRALVPQLPDDHRKELLAFGEQSGVNRDLGLLGNMIVDVYRGSIACSSLVVDAEHSATNGPLFGRNLDFYTLGFLDKYTLVTVHRPQGKHAFASVGFPGLLGCVSGINDAGLAIAVHEVFMARDGAAIYNPKGVPYTFCFRRILEECSTVEEAEKLLRSMERTTILSLAVCDTRTSAVFEMTPKTVAVRHGRDGIMACTNHFRNDELAVVTWCPRYQRLVQARTVEKVSIDDLAQKLDEVNMGRLTAQTMIFEPASLKLHLAFGSCPSSALPMKLLDLAPLFKQ